MHPKSCRIYTSAVSGVLYRDDSEKRSGVCDPEFRGLPPAIQEELAGMSWKTLRRAYDEITVEDMRVALRQTAERKKDRNYVQLRATLCEQMSATSANTESPPGVIPGGTRDYAKWAWVDSNYRPHAYQACALTT